LDEKMPDFDNNKLETQPQSQSQPLILEELQEKDPWLETKENNNQTKTLKKKTNSR
jgi:hypothetical protein